MPRPLEFRHGTPFSEEKLQACDLCHARKIKCDKKAKCERCALIGVSCTRQRIKGRRSRRKAQIETSDARPLRNGLQERGQGPRIGSGPSSPSDILHRASRSHERPINDSEHPNNSTTLIQQELDSNSNLSASRTRALEHALTIVKTFATASHQGDHPMHHAEDEDRDNFVLEKIPPELYFMMIHGANRMEMEGLQWADHLSSQTIERMSLAIMSDTVHGQIALHYKLCILSKATVYASRWLRVCPSEHMSDYLDRSRKQYAAAALECLRKIDFSRSPSISMLQALLAGGAVVQLHGDTTRSWFLISLASRALVALGYHKMTNFNIASNEANEIRRCIYYCYYMDKTSSMLLVRPSSLPDLPFNPADLVHIDINQPISVHVKMLVKLARVQDVALSLMLNPSQQTLPAKDHVLKDIHAELISIGNEIHQLRGQPNAHEPSVLIEWDTVDFTFFSIATTVLRLDSDSLQDITRREECLKYARKALHSMQACQKYIPVKSSITPDYLFWTVLFYPLTPFFVIFCNVVATSNLHDLKLLEEVTVTISRLKEQCTIGKNLHKLLSELIGLCAELHEMPPDRYPRLICNPDGNQAQVHTVPGRDPLGANTDISGQTALPTPGQDDMVPAGVSTFAPGGSNYQENEESARKRVSIWDDGLMTELFNVQPSVEWLDIECVDMIHGFQS